MALTYYGLWDMRDNAWLGNEHGPQLYTDRVLSMAAATIMTERMGVVILSKIFSAGRLRIKDHVEPKIDALTALQRIEGHKEPPTPPKSLLKAPRS